MTVPVSLVSAISPRRARITAASGNAATEFRSLLARNSCLLLALVAVAGCHQQTAPGDPFLPFMRSRVAPPGTTVPPGAVDPYYNGTPGTTTPAAGVPVVPVAPPSAPVDKYSPRGGFNVPQGAVDRTKAVDFAKSNEVKASPTAIARRRLSTPVGGQTQVDTELTTAKETTAGPVDTSLPAVSNLAAMAPLTSISAASSRTSVAAVDSTMPDQTMATASDAEPIFDSAVAAFDDQGRPAAARPTKPQISKPAVLRTAAAEPSQNALPGTRPSVVRLDQPEDENRSTIRIVGSAEDVFADDEPAAQTAGTADARLRMTAGDPRAKLNSKAIDEQPEVQPAVALSGEPRPGLHFNASEPDDGVVQTSWLEPADAATERVSTAAATAVASASEPYRYEPSYGSLSGRLEYSQSARQWKLRYIPIDGTTDQFGGSVLLADPTRLEGFKPGDFVSVRGAIAAASQSTRGFSPRYELSQIEPIR